MVSNTPRHRAPHPPSRQGARGRDQRPGRPTSRPQPVGAGMRVGRQRWSLVDVRSASMVLQRGLAGRNDVVALVRERRRRGCCRVAGAHGHRLVDGDAAGTPPDEGRTTSRRWAPEAVTLRQRSVIGPAAGSFLARTERPRAREPGGDLSWTARAAGPVAERHVAAVAVPPVSVDPFAFLCTAGVVDVSARCSSRRPRVTHETEADDVHRDVRGHTCMCSPGSSCARPTTSGPR